MKAKKDNEMRTEYTPDDLVAGVRGKHHAAYQKSKNIVLLSPDVAEVFPTDEAVNEALRKVIRERKQLNN